MKAIPLYDASARVACTLAPEDVPGRLATFERIRREVHRLERTEHGLCLHFVPSPELEADLRRFVGEEKRCCQFWGFDLRSGEALSLQWDAPPDASELIDELERFFTGTEPADLFRAIF